MLDFATREPKLRPQFLKFLKLAEVATPSRYVIAPLKQLDSPASWAAVVYISLACIAASPGFTVPAQTPL